MHVCSVLSTERLVELLGNDDEHLRTWAIQLLGDASPVNAFQPTAKTDNAVLHPEILQRLSEMARSDSSAVVRLHLAALAQRLSSQRQGTVLLFSCRSRVRGFRGRTAPLVYATATVSYWQDIQSFLDFREITWPQQSLELLATTIG